MRQKVASGRLFLGRGTQSARQDWKDTSRGRRLGVVSMLGRLTLSLLLLLLLLLLLTMPPVVSLF
jgi:hypothetical protein